MHKYTNINSVIFDSKKFELKILSFLCFFKQKVYFIGTVTKLSKSLPLNLEIRQ